MVRPFSPCLFIIFQVLDLKSTQQEQLLEKLQDSDWTVRAGVRDLKKRIKVLLKSSKPLAKISTKLYYKVKREVTLKCNEYQYQINDDNGTKKI